MGPDLELHVDDVYFTLENGAQDGDQRQPGLAVSNTTSSKVFKILILITYLHFFYRFGDSHILSLRRFFAFSCFFCRKIREMKRKRN